jgi:hypothetical protein
LQLASIDFDEQKIGVLIIAIEGLNRKFFKAFGKGVLNFSKPLFDSPAPRYLLHRAAASSQSEIDHFVMAITAAEARAPHRGAAFALSNAFKRARI